MTRSFTSAKAGGRGYLSLTLVLALVLPVLLGLLPPLSSTPAFALDRDLAASLCIDGEEGGSPSSHDDHAQCCILCPAGASVNAALDATPAIPLPRRKTFTYVFAAEAVTATPANEDWHSARGPPAS
jgi:hypothetical protein